MIYRLGMGCRGGYCMDMGIRNGVKNGHGLEIWDTDWVWIAEMGYCLGYGE